MIQNVAGQSVRQSSSSPAHTTTTLSTTAVAIPRQNERQKRSTMPAGAITSVKTSRMPTIRLASDTENARITMKAIDSPESESPRASASAAAGSRKAACAASSASTARLATEKIAISTIWSVDTPNGSPKRIALPFPAKPWHRCRNSVPRPSEKESTMPMAMSLRWRRSPDAPMPNAAASVKTRMPCSGTPAQKRRRRRAGVSRCARARARRS
ncbi:MAG: hypothetical protein WDO13_00040 [Verrucomicrobiota bacterium]